MHQLHFFMKDLKIKWKLKSFNYIFIFVYINVKMHATDPSILIASYCVIHYSINDNHISKNSLRMPNVVNKATQKHKYR